MELSTVLFGVTLAFYCVAGVLFLWSLKAEPGLTTGGAFGFGVLGLAVHSAGLVTRGIQQHRVPFTNLFESLVFFAWALMAVYLVMDRGHRITALGAFASLVASAAIACGLLLPKDVSESLLPALQNRWSTIHIASCLIGYAGFVLAFGSALGYILQESMLKAKRINVFQKRLPPLDVMDRFAYKTVALGFPMLTLGVVTGALWAQAAWGSYWHWDPKETWALVTWLVYAAYLHVRIVQGWRGKWANRLLMTGFACVLVTYFGVNFLASGLHKYNW